MKKEDKEKVVSELTERLRSAETLLVADYRGLTMPQIDELRTRLLASGARFSVVKNTLTRRAAEAAPAEEPASEETPEPEAAPEEPAAEADEPPQADATASAGQESSETNEEAE